MSMKIALTQVILDELVTNAEDEMGVTWKAWLGAESRRNDLRELKVGDVVTFSAASDDCPRLTVTYEPPESHLPDAPFAYFLFPSRSGAKPHEVALGATGSNGQLITSCNCNAGKFKRDCWAQQQALHAYRLVIHTDRVFNPRPGFGELRDAV
jgi:hypothetical protein